MQSSYNLFIVSEATRLGKEEFKRLGGMAYVGSKWTGFSQEEKDVWHAKAEAINFPNGRPKIAIHEVSQIPPPPVKKPIEMTSVNLDEVLLNLAKERKEILAYQIVSGGFEFGETTNNLYSFKDEEALSEWLKLKFTDEKESDHKQDPWKVTFKEVSTDIYSFVSSTNCRPWESGWSVNTFVTVYNPDTHLKDANQREPQRSINIYGPNSGRLFRL